MVATSQPLGLARCTAFLAVAEEEYGRQIPFAFLERVQAEWKEKFADKARTATAHSLDKTFGCASHLFLVPIGDVAVDSPPAGAGMTEPGD